MMLPFALLVLVVMLLLFNFVNRGVAHNTNPEEQVAECAQGAEPLQIKEGQTCWEIGQAHGLGVDELLGMQGNEGLDCDRLRVGRWICVPAK
jgi:hypothetical protein